MTMITLYSQPGCGPCISVKTHLRKSGVGYVVRDVTADPAAAAEVAALGYLGTPVVTAGDMHTYGYRRDWLNTVVAAVQAEESDAASRVVAELDAIAEVAA